MKKVERKLKKITFVFLCWLRRCQRVCCEQWRLWHKCRLCQHSWKFHMQLSYWIRRRWIYLHRWVKRYYCSAYRCPNGVFFSKSV